MTASQSMYVDVAAARIQHYIGRTPRLKGQRGASAWLSWATSAEQVKKVLRGHPGAEGVRRRAEPRSRPGRRADLGAPARGLRLPGGGSGGGRDAGRLPPFGPAVPGDQRAVGCRAKLPGGLPRPDEAAAGRSAAGQPAPVGRVPAAGVLRGVPRRPGGRPDRDPRENPRGVPGLPGPLPGPVPQARPGRRAAKTPYLPGRSRPRASARPRSGRPARRRTSRTWLPLAARRPGATTSRPSTPTATRSARCSTGSRPTATRTSRNRPRPRSRRRRGSPCWRPPGRSSARTRASPSR